MYHRIIEVDSPATRLRVETGSLRIDTREGRTTRFRIKELDCVLLGNPAVTLSNEALREISCHVAKMGV